jgi:hypothetical protein
MSARNIGQCFFGGCVGNGLCRGFKLVGKLFEGAVDNGEVFGYLGGTGVVLRDFP